MGRLSNPARRIWLERLKKKVIKKWKRRCNMSDAKERKPLMAFGIDFSQIPHMDQETADRVIRGVTDDMRSDVSFSRDPRRPRHHEEPGINARTLGLRFEPR